ncbi:hypothetical protein NE237_016231 [Protea cynaroides]|uniref:DUF3511 domain-containing protein n=1 Tax=Protea cynaroides TaxID=273540 RepID=A0A9Q0KFL8_9MAGN|nr:hypothetical protein NE237_016231 [Protea cynaroides]
MAAFRPSYGTYGRDQKLENVNGKEFSANQAYSYRSHSPDPPPRPSYNSRASKKSSSSSSKSWSFNNPDMKRRKRVAQYKIYAVEGKVKSSFRRGLRWIKNKCSEIVHGF